MNTVYIQRETEDVDEDTGKIHGEVDLFLDGRGVQVDDGLNGLTHILGA